MRKRYGGEVWTDQEKQRVKDLMENPGRYATKSGKRLRVKKMAGLFPHHSIKGLKSVLWSFRYNKRYYDGSKPKATSFNKVAVETLQAIESLKVRVNLLMGLHQQEIATHTAKTSGITRAFDKIKEMIGG